MPNTAISKDSWSYHDVEGVRVIRMSFVAVAVAVAGSYGSLLSAQEVFTAGNGVSAPTVLKQVPAYYTPTATFAGIEGVVGLQAVVLPDGTVGDVAITQSLDAANGLDQQAIDALKRWQFNPGRKDTEAVAVRIDVETTFTLK